MFMSCLSAANISGTVVNKANGQAIEYANVILKESQQGASTNHKGYFVITQVKPGKYTLFISLIGYEPLLQEVIIKNNKDDAFSKFELVKKTIEMQATQVKAKYEEDEINSKQIRVSNTIHTTAQIQETVTAGEADVIRAIIALPGVTPISDFSSGMYVRGGSPDQNLILLDDIDVYNPNHFGGIFSTFNTDAVDNIELLKGGFPSKYGERLSSVLNVRNRDGNRKEMEGVSRLSFISASTTVEGPWKIGSHEGSYMGSFRRSYVDMVAKFIDEIPDYYFYDGHAKINYDLDMKNKLSISTYFGKDRLNMDLGTKMAIEWGNSTFTAQWVHLFTAQLFSHFIVAGSTFESNFGLKTDGGAKMDRKNTISDLTVKGIVSYKPNNDHLWEFGFENKFNDIRFNFTTSEAFDPEKTPNIKIDALTSSVYFQDTLDMDIYWRLQPGLKISNHRSLDINLPSAPKADYTRVSPRISLRRVLDENSNVYVSYGKYYQYLTLISVGMSSPFDVWFPLDDTVEPGESDHYILGYKRELTAGLVLETEAYYKTYDNLTEYRMETDYEWNNNTGTLKDVFNLGKGYTQGMDVLLRNDIFGMSGFIGYTYSNTRRKIEEYNTNPDTNEPEYYYPKYDKTHSLSVIESYNMTQHTGRQLWGADIKFAVNYSLASGQPDPIPEQYYYDGNYFSILYSYSDRTRLPNYSRCDVSFKLQWNKKHYTIEPYIQIINLFNRKNIWTRAYNFDVDNAGNFSLKHEDATMFPRLPFLGVDIKW
jgi:hypothetical protein